MQFLAHNEDQSIIGEPRTTVWVQQGGAHRVLLQTPQTPSRPRGKPSPPPMAAKYLQPTGWDSLHDKFMQPQFTCSSFVAPKSKDL